MKTKPIHEVTSEVALKTVILQWNSIYIRAHEGAPILDFRRVSTNSLVASLDLRKVIAKRKSLRGVQKELMRAVRSTKGRKR